jgi:DNA-binding response OmpR family regulator
VRILIAEDNAPLADELARSLCQSGSRVRCVSDGHAAVSALRREEYDLLVLDFDLPEKPDEVLLAQLRAQRAHLPVLAISGAGSIADRVRALDAGVDDYLPKPFAFDEFHARARAITRRHAADTARTLTLGPLTYDPAGHIARLHGRVLPLPRRELALLEALIRHAGRWVGKQELTGLLSGEGRDVSRNAVEVYMHRLRGRLGERSVRVLTTRGLGYRLVESTARREAL